MKNHYRQGDLLIVRVDAGDTSTLVKSKTGILALGEVTGHSHKVIGADVFVDASQPFWGQIIQATKDATIKHEEHSEIKLTPGTYKVIHQREWNVGRLSYVRD